MNHYLELATDKLNSLKGQLKYCENELKSDLELWEEKEFKALVVMYKSQIDDQNKLIAREF